MKKNSLLFTVIALSLFMIEVNASSIWFNRPTNGATITGAGYGSTQTTVPLGLEYNQSAQSYFGYYVKLFCPPYANQQSNVGNGIDQWWYLPAGTYSWRLELWEYNQLYEAFKTAEQTITFHVKYEIIITNNFGGGNINIDGITNSSGSTANKITGENLLVGAIDQTYNGQYYLWNQNGTNNSLWQKRPKGEVFADIQEGTPRDFNYTVASNDNGALIQGIYRMKPSTPQGISATFSLNQHPTLSWNTNTEYDLMGYRVYKKLTIEGGAQNTSYVFTTSTTYTDNDFTCDYKTGEDAAEYWIVAESTSNILSEETSHYAADGISAIQWKTNAARNNTEPEYYSLYQNYPNPFNPTTTIRFQIPEDGIVSLKIYDLIGNEMNELINEFRNKGSYEIKFDASELSSGIYFYRLSVSNPAAGESFNASRKLVLMK